MISLHGHDPASYVPHAVHRDPRNYPETNCYTDTLVELLHGHGLEPLAGLGHLVRTDFEGDQFTFFKMPQQDLENGFGIDIHEMQPVGSLPAQIAAQLEQGRTMTAELDSFFLPDVAATDYRRNHVKTTVAVEAVDLEGERLHYFHNLGLHEVSGEDYRGVFHLDGAPPELLPPYLELVRFDVAEPVPDFARDALHHHLRFLPEENPFTRFGRQLEADLPRLLEGDLEDFHAYAFATVRMAGAAFELLQAHVVWLLGEPVAALDRIVEGSKVLSFRLARRRAFDPAPAVEGMAEAWQEAMDVLGRAVPA
ncbi:MAG: hypothetical protein QOI80_3694 [Solirubrobacteraceae bacterium]|nr:hypothetical protein [Solirubrobacteraceae bacterium]